jgi:choline dehydrogenase-like flavoprotein
MRVAISGVGVAGGVIATGLAAPPGVEVLAFERLGPDADNGLNVGPNALLALWVSAPIRCRPPDQFSVGVSSLELQVSCRG